MNRAVLVIYQAYDAMRYGTVQYLARGAESRYTFKGLRAVYTYVRWLPASDTPDCELGCRVGDLSLLGFMSWIGNVDSPTAMIMLYNYSPLLCVWLFGLLLDGSRKLETSYWYFR